MFGLFKPKHQCEWKLVATNDQYHTIDTDTNEKTYYHMRFYQCNCGKRKFSSDFPKNSYHTHKGMEVAKQNWIETGCMPANSIHPSDNKNYLKLDNIKREEIDPILSYQKTLEEIVSTLGVVINRDFNLEARYPKLKSAADEYHRQLDKYRRLKEK